MTVCRLNVDKEILLWIASSVYCKLPQMCSLYTFLLLGVPTLFASLKLCCDLWSLAHLHFTLSDIPVHCCSLGFSVYLKPQRRPGFSHHPERLKFQRSPTIIRMHVRLLLSGIAVWSNYKMPRSIGSRAN